MICLLYILRGGFQLSVITDKYQFAIITVLISPIVRRLLRQQAVENAKVQSHLVESLSAIETIKAEQYERSVIDNWRKNYRKEVGLGYKKDIVSVTAGNAAEFIEQLSGLIAIWFGAYLVINSKLTVGQLFAFRILLRNFLFKM